ncbi:hypothetical protein ACWOFR_04930 [Carnobacterium gallinarum]|uniref:hypothetical protein n=1 Tax=Carnobacterium gallinarum TaxID=2749 RepID=UPI00054D7A14|nr:hypothetical protein [Carnobacterium gallinarum]
MNTKKISIGLLVLVLILGSGIFFYSHIVKKESMRNATAPISQLSSITSAEEQEVVKIIRPTSGYGAKRATTAKNQEALLNFIQKQMTSEFGIYTNFLDTDENQDVATGHEVLSESAGLLLRYSALAKDKKLFDQTWSKALKVFNDQDQFSYRFSPKKKKLYPVNAVVDDLRLVRGLFEGNQAFGVKEYSDLGKTYGSRLLTTNIQGDEMVDFHDSQTDQRNQFVTLCYIDLRTLKLLSLPDNEKQTLLTEQERILTGGYLGDTFPLYQTRYDYQKKTYFDSEEINVVESLLTILRLAEVNQAKTESLNFVKQQVANGKLANRYSPTGKVTDTNQSAAAYGIAAMIASEVGDQEFYDLAMDHMEASQINDSASPLNGGYGDVSTQAAFSFNNLIALLTYQY